jgi:flagellar assembly protein FliH
VALALAFARKLAAEAVARFPTAAVEAAAAECFQEARTAPHVVIRVAAELVETVQQRLQVIAIERGFAGKLVVLGDPDIVPGDGRLEWADGGVAHSAADIDRAIAAAIRQHIAARGAEGADA